MRDGGLRVTRAILNKSVIRQTYVHNNRVSGTLMSFSIDELIESGP